MKSIVSSSSLRFSRYNRVYSTSEVTFTETSLELSPVFEAEVVQSMKAEVLTVTQSELKFSTCVSLSCFTEDGVNIRETQRCGGNRRDYCRYRCCSSWPFSSYPTLGYGPCIWSECSTAALRTEPGSRTYRYRSIQSPVRADTGWHGPEPSLTPFTAL